jgi:hypothetical protein
MSHQRKVHHLRSTSSGPSGGPFREHLNPIQFAVNPLGQQNLYGYRQRDFSGKRSSPDTYIRAVDILGKLASSKGSQAVHALRRSEAR